MKAQVTFQTQNLSLAVVLATIGVPFGQGMPVINYYDREVLREIRDGRGNPRYKGMDVEAAAAQAHKDGKPGIVGFSFERTPLLDAVIEGYTAQERVIAGASTEPNEEGGDRIGNIAADPSQLAAFACQLLKNRRKLRDEWKRPVPVVGFPGETRTVTEGGGTVTTGSLKVIALGASKKTRLRLGL